MRTDLKKDYWCHIYQKENDTWAQLSKPLSRFIKMNRKLYVAINKKHPGTLFLVQTQGKGVGKKGHNYQVKEGQGPDTLKVNLEQIEAPEGYYYCYVFQEDSVSGVVIDLKEKKDQ